MSGTRPLSLERIHFTYSSSLGGQLHCFSAVLRPYNSLGKAFTMSLQTCSFTRISNRHLKPSSPAYKFNNGLHFSYTCCFWLLQLCSHGCRKTNIHTHIQTYKHTHFLENNFSKPGTCPQPAFGQQWAHA